MQHRLTSFTKQVNIYDNIVRLLAGGATQSQVARAIGKSRPYVNRMAKKAVKEGLLTRSGTYPVVYHSNVNQIPLGVREKSPLTPLVLPHRFCVEFMFMRKPKTLPGHWETIRMKNWSRFFQKNGDHTIEVFPSRVKVWLFNFSGRTAQERIRSGTQQAAKFMHAFQRESQCKLCAGKLVHPVEWTLNDQELSNYVTNILKLDEEPREIAGARLKIDSSHPGKVEIDQKKATEVAKDMEWLLTDGVQAIKTAATILRVHQEIIDTMVVGKPPLP